MKKQVLTLLGTLPLVAAGVVFNPVSAQAANIGPLTPPYVFGDYKDIYGFSSVTGGNNGVTVKIDQATQQVTFDFVPPVGPTYGSYQVDYASEAFAGFGGSFGLIKDITIPFAPPNSNIAVPANVPGFLALDNSFAGNDFFDLQSVFAPTFTSIGTGTVVSFGVTGYFKAADGRSLWGLGSFSTTFVGLNQAQIIAFASRPEGIRTPFSATFEAVPEPFTMLGVGTALGFGTLFKRKQAKKENKA